VALTSSHAHHVVLLVVGNYKVYVIYNGIKLISSFVKKNQSTISNAERKDTQRAWYHIALVSLRN
jgi:hypothetical protein